MFRSTDPFEETAHQLNEMYTDMDSSAWKKSGSDLDLVAWRKETGRDTNDLDVDSYIKEKAIKKEIQKRSKTGAYVPKDD
ncbi:MAG: hypothetical protein COB29_10975 [Sulfitobacter sp.]|nr:MAG: hypothetical protein COB29_10975 [Sulfitobacter sp.]